MDNNNEKVKVIGRPKKYYGSSRHSTKTFYFPANDAYDVVWNDFIKICINNNNNPLMFVKNEQYISGKWLRRLVLNYVLNNSKNPKVKDIICNILQVEINSSIVAFNKYNKTKHEKVTVEEVKNKYIK